MSDAKSQKQARRVAVLTLWRVRSQSAGFAVPSEAEVNDIAAEPNSWRDRVTSVEASAWADTIDHLLHQVKFGVDAIVANDQLPEELLSPNGPLPNPTTAEPEPEAESEPESVAKPTPDLVGQLMQWRAGLIAEGVEGADSIKDATLRNLVKFNHTEAEQIAKRIGGPAAHLAPQIADIMAKFTEGGEAANPVAAPAPQPSRPTSGSQTVPPPVLPAASSSPRHARSEGGALSLVHSDFAAYEYGESDVEPTKIRFKTAPDGTVALSYDAHVVDHGKMVIYRVVSGENSTPFKPESGELVSVTTGLVVDDPRFFTSAVRTYQVWCHVGLEQEDACRAQPFLLADGERVSPVEDFTITEDEGRVIGQWAVFEGTNRVRVYRVPLSGDTGSINDERYRICTDDLNLTGFVDTTAERGQRYLYRALAEVTVGESPRLSVPAQQEVLVSVVLDPVMDLAVAVTGDRKSEFDLRWTIPSAGTVRVYRLASEPKGGVEGAHLAEDALGPAGLTEETRIKHPASRVDATTSQMRGVPWPSDWQRAYLVPVTVLNGQVRVGKVTITTRALPPVTDAELIERHHAQIATFGWPRGAGWVKAFVGMESVLPEEICEGSPIAEINQTRYERDGGLTFIPPLTPTGVTVCLVPVAYSEGAEIRGEITTLRYPGLARVKYGLPVPEDSSVATLWLQSELDIELPPHLMLINNHDRFPLSPEDGSFVPLTPPGGGQPVPQCVLDRIPRGDEGFNTKWTIDLSLVSGFFRLFFGASGSTMPLALSDPDLGNLWRPYPGTSR